MRYDKIIDQIEQALFERDEPGCRDTEDGDMLLTRIGRIRIGEILHKFRTESRTGEKKA